MSLISAFSRPAAAFLLHHVPSGLSVVHSSYDLHMPDMPKRPRQHELEDESRVAFRAALPSGWVFHESRQDYGLEGQVEIFEDGRATGRFFNVQLKATDEKRLRNALAVRLKQTTANYYRALDLPVLIVRYHAPTGKLFTKWFHSFDPYYARIDQQSITFRLEESDEWGIGTPVLLIEQLEAWRRYHSATIPLPIRFSVTSSGENVLGMSVAELILELRERAKEAENVVRIERAASADTATIFLTDDGTLIDLQGVASVTVHNSPERDRARFPNDVLLGVALAFDQIGQPDLAARLCAAFASESSIIGEPDVLIRVAGCFSRAHRIREALLLARRLEERADVEGWMAARMVEAIPVLAQARFISAEERAEYQRLLREQLEKAEKQEDRSRAAVLHYNLGKQLWGDWGEALFHFFQAVAWDPAYLDRDYFCAEVGGLFFETREFQFSVDFYSRALELGAGDRVRFLLADALLFAGRYSQAAEAFIEANVLDDPEAPSEFRLKALMVTWLLEQIDRHEESRDVDGAYQLSMTARPGLPAAERQRISEEALARDALCAPAWFTLGVLLAHQDRLSDAFPYFLISALIDPAVVEAWSNALGAGLVSDEYVPLVLDVVGAAYQRNGMAFEREIHRVAYSQGEGFDADGFIESIQEVIAMLPEEREGFTLRMLGPGAEYDEVEINRRNPDDNAS